VLERGEVANSWRHERWDSMRLLTPNWQSRLPGLRYEGPDPDGYMTVAEVTEFIERFAAASRAPVRTGTNVTSVRRTDGGYHVTIAAARSAAGQWSSRAAPATSRRYRRSQTRYRRPSSN
jgi:cation diffusion facilitator CzcD-associated flavoprotein CzcO